MPQRSLPKESCRTSGFRQVAEDGTDGADGLTIDGYATVYGRDLAANEDPTPEAGWAEIDSWEGTFFERFKQGAFRKSLRERTPLMQYDHGRHPLLGSLPLGNWESVSEEEVGLHTVGRVTDNWLTQPFRDAIANGSVNGMSIRFTAMADEWRDATGKLYRDPSDILSLIYDPDPEVGLLRRTIKEARLDEAGPVTWPAYEATSVGMRASGRVVIDLGRLRDPETQRALAELVLLADSRDTLPVLTPSPQPTAPEREAAGTHAETVVPPDEIDARLAKAVQDPFDAALREIRSALSL